MSSILIISALEKNERQIVLNYLTEVKDVRHPDTGTDYYQGTYKTDQQNYKIALVRSDQTNVNAAIETERAINFFKPSYIFFLGVAGGLKDVNIGDVVIGQDVYGYERGKVEEESAGNLLYKARPKFGASSYKLERAATNFSFSSKWVNISHQLVDSNFSKNISVLTGTIAAGEKVIASTSSVLYKFLSQYCSNALAVDMEGIGFLEACRAYPQLQTLLIRGISDLIQNKSDSDSKGSQEYAARNAAVFLFSFIETISIPSNTTRNTDDVLLDILCKYYPEGVKDNRIWLRAGGDLSRLQLSSNGMTQWADAIELMSKGAVNISKPSLLSMIKKDFPFDDFLTTFMVDE